MDTFYVHQNIHSATYFLTICTARGFGIIMDWVCLCYIISVVVFLMVFPGGKIYCYTVHYPLLTPFLSFSWLRRFGPLLFTHPHWCHPVGGAQFC